VSENAKRQLAILFSFISNPTLQPVAEIQSLLGEADNATLTRVDLVVSSTTTTDGEATTTMMSTGGTEIDSRTSPFRGGGYSMLEPPPIVFVDDPPALGDDYQEAKLRAVLKPTSRVLRIVVTDGGAGYTEPPIVRIISQGNGVVGVKREAVGCAILDRNGSVDEIILLDPGYGYRSTTANSGGVLQVKVDAPPSLSKAKLKQRKKLQGRRTAKAIAELEGEIVKIDIVKGGNGFVISEPPSVVISPPDELPDWYVAPSEFLGRNEEQGSFVQARVSEMRLGDGTTVSPSVLQNLQGTRVSVDRAVIERLQREPLELLPFSKIRPQRIGKDGSYTIVGLPAPTPAMPDISPRFRAVDPIFGAVGTVPVTRGATELSVSEYSRLALSGGVCTVIVRTLLNPLELVKTKVQLQNDEALNTLTQRRASETRKHDGPGHASTIPMAATGDDKAHAGRESIQLETESSSKAKVGTVDVLKSMVELRGVGSLFQSADITFLASVAFGSFGFGATELFRRSFSVVFFSSSDAGGSEFVLLAAAAVATLVTAAVASPLEVLRVKSMGYVEAKRAPEVFRQFLIENNGQGDDPSTSLTDLVQSPKDLLPLWSGFAPTVARELPFAVTKFLVFDVIARITLGFINTQVLEEGALPVQVGVGTIGLTVSAAAGALAGIAGAIVSHPADLILTLTSSASPNDKDSEDASSNNAKQDWKVIVRDLLSRDGGVANLFIGLPARAVFFFLVIGLQFFLYDYVKNVFQVGSDDLSLVLDVFYAVRQGLMDMSIVQ